VKAIGDSGVRGGVRVATVSRALRRVLLTGTNVAR